MRYVKEVILPAILTVAVTLIGAWSFINANSPYINEKIFLLISTFLVGAAIPISIHFLLINIIFFITKKAMAWKVILLHVISAIIASSLYFAASRFLLDLAVISREIGLEVINVDRSVNTLIFLSALSAILGGITTYLTADYSKKYKNPIEPVNSSINIATPSANTTVEAPIVEKPINKLFK